MNRWRIWTTVEKYCEGTAQSWAIIVHINRLKEWKCSSLIVIEPSYWWNCIKLVLPHSLIPRCKWNYFNILRSTVSNQINTEIDRVGYCINPSFIFYLQFQLKNWPWWVNSGIIFRFNLNFLRLNLFFSCLKSENTRINRWIVLINQLVPCFKFASWIRMIYESRVVYTNTYRVDLVDFVRDFSTWS
jgi:hypothetical protein